MKGKHLIMIAGWALIPMISCLSPGNKPKTEEEYKKGYFAIQCHNPGMTIEAKELYYRDMGHPLIKKAY